jgi:hypothetical protein
VVPRERPPLWPLEGWRRGIEEGSVSVIVFVYRYSDLHSLRLSTPVEGGGGVLRPSLVLLVWRRYNIRPALFHVKHLSTSSLHVAQTPCRSRY